MCREQVGGSWDSLGGNSLGEICPGLWMKAQAVGCFRTGGRDNCGEVPRYVG